MNQPATKSQASKSILISDLLASVVVFLVAIPLCMGIAIASGVPPAAGLITGIIGGLVVGFLSGSPLQVSGPAAGLAVIVFEFVHENGIAMLGPVLLLAGLIQFVAGQLKIGRWFRAISPAVVYGMLAGIGLLIVAGQFHVLIDDKPRASGLANLAAIPEAILKSFDPAPGKTHQTAAIVGLFTLAVLVLWNQFRPVRLKMIPGTLVAVVAATSLTAVTGLTVNHVNLPAQLTSAFSFPTLSSLTHLANPEMIMSALALALVASAETLLSAAAVDKMHSGVRTNFDKELWAQGVGNMLCGVLGALPMTGVIVRSSANVQAGAKTRRSAILHGVWILALVAIFPVVLRLVPTASLAAVLVFTGFKLVDWRHLQHLREYGRMPIVIYASTVIGIVTTDLLTGVMIGIGLTFAALIYKATLLSVRVELNPANQTADVHLIGVASFLRFPQLAAALETVPSDAVMCLHVEHLRYIDHTCYDLLRSQAAQREETGGRIEAPWKTLKGRYLSPHVGESTLASV